MRRVAFWLLFAPIPDPDLRLEMMGWAMLLFALADLRDRFTFAWSAAR